MFWSQYLLLAAGLYQLVAWCLPWQRSPLLSQKQMELIPPLRARTRKEKQKDCKRGSCLSVQQYQYLAIQQGSKLIPGGLNYLCFPLAHNPTTLRDRKQSFGQLHGWSGGVVSPRLPLGFLLRQGAPVLRGLAAVQSLGYSSPLCFGSSAGEKVVRARDVRLWRVAAVQFCLPLQKVFS
jgi:hypothetical protein